MYDPIQVKVCMGKFNDLFFIIIKSVAFICLILLLNKNKNKKNKKKMSLFENTKMEDDDDEMIIQLREAAAGINRNNVKRKFHPSDDQSLDVPKPKHVCMELHSSQGDSNSFSEDADSVMSVSTNDQYSANDEISSSVNWSANLYPCPSFQEGESANNTSDYKTKQLEQDELLDDLFCSNAVVVPNNFVLSSGRWDIIQDAEQGSEKLTIDKEFEQYFSMLML